jgi:hypothetical protein
MQPTVNSEWNEGKFGEPWFAASQWVSPLPPPPTGSGTLSPDVYTHTHITAQPAEVEAPVMNRDLYLANKFSAVPFPSKEQSGWSALSFPLITLHFPGAPQITLAPIFRTRSPNSPPLRSTATFSNRLHHVINLHLEEVTKAILVTGRGGLYRVVRC